MTFARSGDDQTAATAARTVLPDYEAREDVRASDGARGPLEMGDPALPAEPGVADPVEVAPPATAHEEVLVLDFGGQ